MDFAIHGSDPLSPRNLEGSSLYLIAPRLTIAATVAIVYRQASTHFTPMTRDSIACLPMSHSP